MKTLTADSGVVGLDWAGPLRYWHLLSLDAPCVAAVWTAFVARVARVTLPWNVPVAMFVAVWVIYATDRLLDAGRQENLEARHRFHGRHRRGFSIALVVACCGLVPLIGWMPVAMLRLYAELGGLLVVWLGVIHLLPRRSRRPIPKELAVGMFFGAALFVPAMSVAPSARLVAAALVTANLCSLNCLFIYAWEHPASGGAHASTRFGMRWLREIAVGSVAVPLALIVVIPSMGALLVAASLAAGLLVGIDRWRIERTALRAAADAVLLTPLVVMVFLR
jgi:hypothetical protein